MPDTSFLSAFAEHPLTLTILMMAAIFIVIIWKIAPQLKDIIAHVDKGNSELNDKVTHLLASDSEQTKSLGELSEHIRINTLDTLRLTIYNEEVDPEDRLVAARRYFLRGGNGKVLPYVKGLIAKYDYGWKAILAMSNPQERKELEKIITEA